MTDPDVGNVQPSAQGPCICTEGAVMFACPRHAFMWDYVGQNPFKDQGPRG